MISPEDDVNLSVQHQFCPKDSWCRYWADNSNYSEASRSSSVFNLILNPIFSRLSNEDILRRCLKGLTQNQNEAINGMLWSVCPKTKFCGRSKVLLAVADTGMGHLGDAISAMPSQQWAISAACLRGISPCKST